MSDPVLVIVTIVSLCIASVMSVITWNVLRRERRRDETGVGTLPPAVDRFEATDMAVSPWPPARRTAPEVTRAANQTVEARPVLLFRADQPDGHGRRLMTAVALGTAVVIAALGILAGFGPSSGGQPGLSPAAARVKSPIELVRLDHARDGQRLSIHGLVRNPASGSRMEGLVAVVFLFDKRGEYVATTQAPVVERVLQPGAESAFDIPVSSGLNVSRYRLTFRIATAPVPHIDRRAMPPASSPPSLREPIARHASMMTAAADVR